MNTDAQATPGDAMELIATFEVRRRRYLDIDGTLLVAAPPVWTGDPEVVLPLYRAMIETRVFDAKALALQRTGRLGTYGSPLGQEAISVAVASAMQPADLLAPTYREFGAQFWRGVSMTEILLYWGGDERGSDFAGPREDFPICVPIATHCCHAVGAAYAFKLRREPRVAVCFLGDGATSKGDFYESLNAAGAWGLPVLFVVSNNQWAISVPRARQSAAETLAQKAIAAGVACEQVDGNDALAMREAAGIAIERARRGGGPYLIEALTYRLGDHTTADDASRYRPSEEVEVARHKDPVVRLRAYIDSRGWWNENAERELIGEANAKVDAAVAAYEATPAQEPGAMFDYLYAELPAGLAEQRRAVLEDGAGNG